MRCQPNWVRTGRLTWPFFQFLHRAFKFGHHHAVAEPAQIAALRRAAVLRILSRQFAEITALFRLRADFVNHGFGSGYGVFFFRLNQNMLGAVLARRFAFRNGDALLLRPCQCGIDFRLADARVLQNGLLLYFCATSASAVCRRRAALLRPSFAARA